MTLGKWELTALALAMRRSIKTFNLSSIINIPPNWAKLKETEDLTHNQTRCNTWRMWGARRGIQVESARFSINSRNNLTAFIGEWHIPKINIWSSPTWISCASSSASPLFCPMPYWPGQLNGVLDLMGGRVPILSGWEFPKVEILPAWLIFLVVTLNFLVIISRGTLGIPHPFGLPTIAVFISCDTLSVPPWDPIISEIVIKLVPKRFPRFVPWLVISVPWPRRSLFPACPPNVPFIALDVATFSLALTTTAFTSPKELIELIKESSPAHRGLVYCFLLAYLNY
jgi:hypothetical protein